MAELNEEDREVIELRHHGGMSFKEMAEMLGEPMGTLLARHHRALHKLRRVLEQAGVNE
jgi:RNA polymerase sigma-70 factor (ECF subfamily)